MANDISDINSVKQHKTSTTMENEQAAGKTHINYSTEIAEKLDTLEKQLSQQPPVDVQKIARVRSSIESGEYRLDSEKIAEKMLNFESNLDKEKD